MSTDDNIHSKRCMAHAMICAVENFRDREDFDTVALQTSPIGEEAGWYLLTMPEVCKCHVFPIEDVKDTYKLSNAHEARRTAHAWLTQDRITLTDYTKLMGWLDRAERAEWTDSNPDSIGAGYPEESM